MVNSKVADTGSIALMAGYTGTVLQHFRDERRLVNLERLQEAEAQQLLVGGITGIVAETAARYMRVQLPEGRLPADDLNLVKMYRNAFMPGFLGELTPEEQIVRNGINLETFLAAIERNHGILARLYPDLPAQPQQPQAPPEAGE